MSVKVDYHVSISPFNSHAVHRQKEVENVCKALSVLTTISLGFLLTAALLVVAYVYHVPSVDSETLASRLQQTGKPLCHQFKDAKRNIIFHRGGVLDRPENTIEGIILAHEQGARAVEVDLEFTSDGVGVLMHDGTVDRTTDGSGPIAEMDYETVRKLDAAAKHACRNETGPMKVPSMEECVEECLKLDMMIYIDCKSRPTMTAELIDKLYKKYPLLYDKAIVCSFNPLIIYAVRKKDPAILTGLTHRHNVISREADGSPRYEDPWKRLIYPLLDVLLAWSHYSWLWYICGNSFFLINKDGLSHDLATFWRTLDIQVVPWTVNNPHEKEFFLHSINCPIMTDGMHSK